MAGHGKGDPRKVVMAAMAGNAAITVAKLVAALLSGSVSMLAEAVHSLADTANQGLLLVGMRLARRRDPERYPFGRAAEAYFWAFIVALVLFSLGGMYAIYEGVHRVRHAEEHTGSLVAPLVVLALSLAFEGASFTVAFREFQKVRGNRPLRQALFESRDPTIPVVLLEDSAAMCGLVLAFVAVGATWLTGSSLADGIGSIVIGILLCGVGLMLAYDIHGLLIGESATPETRRRVLEIARATEGVEDVTQALTLHLGPDTVLLAMKVRFRPGSTVSDVERVTDLLEERIRTELPQMKRIFVEADGNYDAALDPGA